MTFCRSQYACVPVAWYSYTSVLVSGRCLAAFTLCVVLTSLHHPSFNMRKWEGGALKRLACQLVEPHRAGKSHQLARRSQFGSADLFGLTRHFGGVAPFVHSPQTSPQNGEKSRIERPGWPESKHL